MNTEKFGRQKKSCYAIVLVVISAVIIAVLFGMTACAKRSYIDFVKRRWDITLPQSMQLIYGYDNTAESFHGDGERFYVYDAEISGLPVDFVAVNAVVIGQIDGVFDTFLQEVPTAYRCNWQHNCVYYYQSENDGRDFIYLIYDNTLSRLSILEYHS